MTKINEKEMAILSNHEEVLGLLKQLKAIHGSDHEGFAADRKVVVSKLLIACGYGDIIEEAGLQLAASRSLDDLGVK